MINLKQGNIMNRRKTTNKYGGHSKCEYPVIRNNLHAVEYEKWSSMLKRCYSESMHRNRPSYINCTVCDEWMYYKNFYEWMHNQDNFIILENIGEKYHLDKDILCKNNKIYSPDTCELVPYIVNTLFISCRSNRGKFPVGVYYETSSKKYKAQGQNYFTGKYTNLGRYNTSNEAFYLGYKPFKEGIIKKVAEQEYVKGTITKRCFDAMMNYEIKIDD